MATYNVTTNFGAKDDLASGVAAKKIKGSEFTTEFTNIATAVNSKADTTTVNAVTTTANAALPKSGGAMTGAITTNSTFDGVDIATRDAVLTTTTTTANAALPKSGGTMSGAIAMGTSKITGAGDPTDAQDVATKAYVDANAGSGDVTLSGNNAFTGNNTFSTEIAANAGIAVAGSADITTASAVNATASTFKNGSYTAGKVNTHVQSSSGSLSIGKQGAGLRFSHYLDNFGLTVRNIIPYNVDTNSNSDNLVDLGNSSARFDDIYATNATIQTSDRNEKQDIAELSAAETRVAVACKGLLRKFRWKSSVEEKGDAARTHFGIIAQDLQAAFEAEGLDAGNYAMFISTTWTNEDGEEQTRLGVRYSELLAFIIGGI